MWRRALVSAGIVAALIACSSTDESPTGNGGSGGMGGRGGAGQGAGPTTMHTGGNFACEVEGFEADTQVADYIAADDHLNVIVNTDGAEFDTIALQLFYERGANPGPHSFEFLAEDYADCSTCALLYQQCDDTQLCLASYLIESGTLDVTANGMVGERFEGTLRDAVFVEVEIDPNTFIATPVMGGCRWIVDSLSLDAMIQ